MQQHRPIRSRLTSLLAWVLIGTLSASTSVTPLVARQGGQPPGSLPPGAVLLPPDEVRQWGDALFSDYAAKAARITGNRDQAGRLLDINGQVLPATTQVGLLLTRDAVVKKLETFVVELDAHADLSRGGKVALSEDLAAKAETLRQAHAEYEKAKSDFQSYLPSEVLYRNQMAGAAELEAQGRADDAREMRAKANSTFYAKYIHARDRYVSLLDATPLLGLKVDDVFLYDAYEGLTLAPNPADDRNVTTRNDQVHIDLVNAYLAAGSAQSEERIAELRNTWDLERLAEFASPRYSAIHDHWTRVGQALGVPLLVNLMAETTYASESYLRGWVDEAWERMVDQALVIVGVGGLFIPGIGTVVSLGVSGVQLYRSGGNYYVAYVDAQEALETAPATSFGTVVTADDAEWEARKTLGLDVAFFGLDAYGAVRHIRTARAEHALAAEREAAREGNALLDAAIPAGRRATVTSISDANEANAMLRRSLDTQAATQFPRHAPGNAEFFIAQGLQPQRTITAGAVTFHVSAPFRGPGERIAVIAFEQLADGKLLPRTWYFSGEHGIWRAATARGFGGMIDKGPVELIGDLEAGFERNYLNKGSADLAGELQGPLSRWHAEAGAAEVPDTYRAFFGWLEDAPVESGREFGLHVTPRDTTGNYQFTDPGSRPDLSAAPFDSWRVRSPIYGTLEGRLYPSEDGATLFVVLVDADGHVFVPSVQDAEAGLTAFGTRWSAIRTPLTSTPRVKNDNLPGIVEVPDSAYFFNPRYRNSLNEVFANANLPPLRAPDAIGPPAPAVGATPAPADPVPGILERLASNPAALAANLGRASALAGGVREAGAAGVYDMDQLIEGARGRARSAFGAAAQQWSVYPSGPDGVMIRSPDGLRVVIAYPGITSLGQPVISLETYEKDGRLWEHRRMLNGIWIETSSANDPPPAPGGGAITPRPSAATASPAADQPFDRDDRSSTTPSLPTSVGAIGTNVSFAETVSPIATTLRPGPDETATLPGEVGGLVPPGTSTGTAMPAVGTDPTASLAGFAPNIYAVNAGAAPTAVPHGNLPTDDRYQLFIMQHVNASVASGSPSAARGSLPPGTILRVSPRAAQDPTSPLTVSVVATGASSGDAFVLDVVTPAGRPVQVVAPDGLVLQAMRSASPPSRQPRRAGAPPFSAIGFCLEYMKPPPPGGTLYRVASQELQERFRPMHGILQAGRRLAEAGLLNPDSDPVAYVTFIRQWALWTRLEGWNLDDFTREFVARTRKNVEDLGDAWIPALGDALIGVAPNRFADIQRVLEEADRLVGMQAR